MDISVVEVTGRPLMAPSCISDERAVAVSAERFWKVFSDPPSWPKVCAGFFDAIEVEGDGGPGTINILKFNPAIKNGSYKTRVVARDNTAHFLKSEVLDVPIGRAGKLKSQLTETNLEATGASSCMVKLKVEYEREDGSLFSPEQEKIVLDGYFGMYKMIEDYLIAHPAEYLKVAARSPPMAPVCISDERAVAVSVERMWNVFSDRPAMPKICAGLVDAIEVEGDGGPGTISTMTLNPAAEGGGLYKTRVVACDNTAHVLKLEVLDVPVGKVDKLKSHSTQTKLEAVSANSCVAKVTVEYELEDGGSLSPEKEKIILDGYYGMLKMIEGYLVAHPNEYA
uniref:Bet v I/Major latex protein domain-containing protein n=1 Tax=Leersia perrieri TaxID=77586 RepID=A0A0D9Y077_9ORYZ